MQPVRIVAELTLKPGFRDALMPVLQALVEGSRAEPGNVQYDFLENQEASGNFFVIEEWRSAQDLETHTGSPHFRAFAEAVEGKAEGLRITTLSNVFPPLP